MKERGRLEDNVKNLSEIICRPSLPDLDSVVHIHPILLYGKVLPTTTTAIRQFLSSDLNTGLIVKPTRDLTLFSS